MTEFRKINETPTDLFAFRSKQTQNAKPTKRTRAHIGSLKSKSLPSKNSIHYELNRHSKSVASLVKLHLHVDRSRRSHRRSSVDHSQQMPKKPPRYPPRTSTENSRRKNVHRDKMPLPEPRKRTKVTTRAPQNGGVIENENIYEIIDGIKS